MFKLAAEKIEDVDQGQREFCVVKDDGIYFDPSKIKTEDVSGLKSALAKQTNDAKANKKLLDALQKKIDDDQDTKDKDSGNFKILFEKSEAEKTDLANDLKTTKTGAFASSIIQKLGITGKQAGLLKNHVESMVQYDSASKVASVDPSSGFVDVETLVEGLKKDYEFLLPGSNADGDNSGGNGDQTGKTIKRGKYNDLPSHEQDKFLQDGGKLVD